VTVDSGEVEAIVGRVVRALVVVSRLPPQVARRRTPRASPGFTLIELLVVIGVIALLIGIITPAISRTRETARSARCLANLRSLGSATQGYIDTQGQGRLLPRTRALGTGGSAADPTLVDVLSPYLDGAQPYLQDPADEFSWIVAEPWRCPSDIRSNDVSTQFRPFWQTNGRSYEYLPTVLMDFAEAGIFVTSPSAAQQAQIGVSRAIEQRGTTFGVFIDADDWHNPRFGKDENDPTNARTRWKRNAGYAGDWHAADAPYVTIADDPTFFEDVRRFGGSG
jgi:prepilin-type N-terminal cleavage/methylation domain-containing protein